MNDIESSKLGRRRHHSFQVGGGKLPPLSLPLPGSRIPGLTSRFFRPWILTCPYLELNTTNQGCRAGAGAAETVYSEPEPEPEP